MTLPISILHIYHYTHRHSHSKEIVSYIWVSWYPIILHFFIEYFL